MTDLSPENFERLVRVETQIGMLVVEFDKLRPSVHLLVSQQNALSLLAEEARESREDLRRDISSLTTKIDPMITAVALGATTMAMHMQKCDESEKRHDERYNTINAQLGTISKYVWAGIGIIAALSVFAPFLFKKLGLE